MAKQTTATEIEPVGAEAPSGGGIFRGNLRTLGIIGILLLAGVGLFWFLQYQSAKSNEEAMLELSRIRPYYERGEWAAAIAGDPQKRYGTEPVRGLQAIVKDYGSTHAGRIAALFLGNSYLAQGEYDKARSAYETAAGADAPIVVAGGNAGLGAVAEAKNKFDEAASSFVKAAEQDHYEVNSAEYLLNAARNFERAGKKEEAIKYYRTVATKYPQATEANTQARMALARNNVQL